MFVVCVYVAENSAKFWHLNTWGTFQLTWLKQIQKLFFICIILPYWSAGFKKVKSREISEKTQYSFAKQVRGVKGRFNFFRIFIKISDSDHPQVDSDTYLNQENFAKMCFKWIQSKSLMSFGGNCMSLNLSLILPEWDLTKYCEWGKDYFSHLDVIFLRNSIHHPFAE